MTSARKRILFVDDEPQVLGCLLRLLDREGGRWEMVFASSGQRALHELARQWFDVVVTDMRMPEIDGATVLHAVAEQSPETLRILLTGYADDEALARVRPVVHQLLEKPCSASVLRAAIEARVEDTALTTSPIAATDIRAARRDTPGPRRSR
jgi:DNA-binding NtrC family response regulator